MCGITCIILEPSSGSLHLLNETFDKFRRQVFNRGPDYLSSSTHVVNDVPLLFAASVLWLQGTELRKQPLENERSVLVYNGDVYNGSCFNGDKISSEGDTVLFLQILEKNDILRTLSKVHGPYSFIYLSKDQSRLYFARDFFGRKSLLIGRCNEHLVITSVATKSSGFTFIELPALGLFSLDLRTRTFGVYLWNNQHANYSQKILELELFLNNKITVLNESNLLIENNLLLPDERDLNIFARIKGLSLNEAFEVLLSTEKWFKNVVQLLDLLQKSVATRVKTQPNYCKACVDEKKNCSHALTGILFSGGLDCAVLAVLVDKYTPIDRPIDLLNVAFDRNNTFNTPDRKTALQTLEELQCLCPKREWNFLAINVTQEELQQKRKEVIADLIHPLNTVLDDSLGCALWFAARGTTNDHKSSSRILITGMGADELFGGYSRHRTTLHREGWSKLQAVLDEEWQNISHRNLARDDRVVADSGRQLRLPYLDEDVVNFVRNLPCWERTCPSENLPQGFGEKLLLRTLAYYLGLKGAANFKKRALQFGSRIANPKENAHDVSKRL